MIAEGWLERFGRGRPRRSPNGLVLGASRRRRARTRRIRAHAPRLIAAAALLLALLLGGWFWLRDSSLVSVRRVTITGVRGPDAQRIRRALAAAARTMTTLDVQMGQLRTAVAPYPVVKSLDVSTQFPHGIRIHVVEQIPVGAVSVDGRLVAVASDGTLLHDLAAPQSLPLIPMRVPPGGTRLSDPQARDAVAVLAAAPYQLLARIAQVGTTAAHGLVAQLRNGPSIDFGDGSRLQAKWAAAVAVLADPGSAGAAYIDVSDPEHPAAGAGGGTTATTASATAGTAASGTAGTAASGTAGTTASGAAGTTASGTAGTTASGAAGTTSGG